MHIVADLIEIPHFLVFDCNELPRRREHGLKHQVVLLAAIQDHQGRDILVRPLIMRGLKDVQLVAVQGILLHLDLLLSGIFELVDFDGLWVIPLRFYYV